MQVDHILAQGRAAPLAEVVVDVALQEQDEIYHYIIPPELYGRLQVGQRVSVPFGRRRLMGFVVGFTSESPVAAEKLRPIHGLDPAELHLTPEAVELADWLALRYISLRVQALRAMLPPGARQGKIRPRRARFVVPTVSREQLAAQAAAKERRAPRQAALLTLLQRHPQGLLAQQALQQTESSHSSLQALARQGLVTFEQRVVERNPLPPTPAQLRPPLAPTEHQAAALAALTAALERRRGEAFLLFGATGSGKTEVYLQAIRRCLAAGRTAICLVPEISLTPQTVDRFVQALGGSVAVLHSGLSAGERYDQWQRLRRGEVQVVVGARSAVFAPLANLGLIIIDEEHEPAFKQDETPRYHARTVAWQRVKGTGGVLLCGSASPSLEAWHQVDEGNWQLLTMPHRIHQRPMPPVEIVDQRDPKVGGAKSILTLPLAAALQKCVAAGQQALLFLNRRGFATIILCRHCGHTEQCPNCSVALTFHRHQGQLLCHYCAYGRQPPAICPKCAGHNIGYFGVGTQRVEEAARKLLPQARIARLDADTAARKGSHERIYRAFTAGEIDVLVGTQMIAKGWDVPGVTLVGVISADTSLHLPDFRSAERTMQLLLQVAGRAGRGDEPGRVLIQTFNPEHAAVKAVQNNDPETFWAEERVRRQMLGYPPFGRLIRFLATAPSPGQASGALQTLASKLAAGLPGDVEILGPAEAPLGRLRSRYRWQLVLRGAASMDDEKFRRQLTALLPARGTWQVDDTRVSVDVDPVSLL